MQLYLGVQVSNCESDVPHVGDREHRLLEVTIHYIFPLQKRSTFAWEIDLFCGCEIAYLGIEDDNSIEFFFQHGVYVERIHVYGDTAVGVLWIRCMRSMFFAF